MKVLHLCWSDARGGAAKAAHRLHRGLLERGVDSRMWVHTRLGDDPTVDAPTGTLDRAWAVLTPALNRVPLAIGGIADRGNHSTAWVGTRVRAAVRSFAPDLVQLHWLGGGLLRLESLARLAVPLVWRLPDMWAFCGAEHYADERLGRWRAGYDRVPRPEARGWDVSRWVWERKRRAWAAIPSLQLVAPSRWLARCVAESALLADRPLEVIPTGQDVTLFRPVEAAVARERLDLPRSARILLIGADRADRDPRKGVDLAEAAVAGLRARDAWVVSFGDRLGRPRFGGLPLRELGPIADADALAALYSAADVFLAPSRQENLANTVIEAMACGTPAVAFDVGGMPDLIRDRVDGCLAPPFDVDAYAAAIDWLLAEPGRRVGAGAEARRRIEKDFSLERQTEAYLGLYEAILARGAAQRR